MNTSRRLIFLLLALLGIRISAAPLQVVTLHPVLNDVAAAVGGDKVKVISLVGPGADIHTFSPTYSDIKKLSEAHLILVSGKGLENYLDKLRANGRTIIEVGRTIPSLKIDPADALFMCCPAHAKGAIDPHWWNSPENMARAGRIIADAFTEADPANKAAWRAGAAAWSTRMEALRKQAKQTFSTIPAARRRLATAHLSMSYFAREFGFRLVPVQGLNHNQQATAQELAAAIKTIRENKITAIFPEQGVNSKYLTQLSTETGVKLGGELIADGNGSGKLAGYEAAFLYNVQTIATALRE
jgi:zinc/manganese transport system substrate-binding protein